jgi:hypothetical protein
MSHSEIQRDAVELMKVQGVLKFMILDHRVRRPVLDVRQLILRQLRDYPVEDFR